jgi:hypothetical protein
MDHPVDLRVLQFSWIRSAVEQPAARVEEHRGDGDVELIDESGVQELLDGVGTTPDPDVPIVGDFPAPAEARSRRDRGDPYAPREPLSYHLSTESKTR